MKITSMLRTFMSSTRVLLLFMVGIPMAGLCQGEADWWYFTQRVGLHFQPGQSLPTPIHVTPLQGGTSMMTSISDPCGNLLFVAQPDTIYDSSLTPMPNGNLRTINFAGLYSQVIIAPQPGNSTNYYVFYPHRFLGIGGQDYTLNYSVVDMSLNGGLGDVTLKNVQLHTNSSTYGAATLHENGEDIWVVYLDRDSTTFYSYLVTNAGVQAPVITTFSGYPLAANSYDVLGSLVFSPDGLRAAATAGNKQLCLLMDFDPATGVFSTPLSLGNVLNPGLVTTPVFGPVSFSPDGKKLYRSSNFGLFITPSPFDLVQFDLTSNSLPLIQASGVSIGSSFPSPPYISANGLAYHDIRPGPDGKIYVCDEITLNLFHRINHPNQPGGSSDFQFGFMSLGVNTFPSFSYPYFLPYFPWFMLQQNSFAQAADSGYMQVCLPDSAVLRVTQSWRLDSVVWDMGVPGMAPVVSTADSLSFLFPAPGIYPVEALVFRGCPTRADTIRDTVEVFVTPDIDFPEDSAICQGATLSLDVSTPAGSYLWQDGSMAPTFQTGTAGLIWAEVSNLCATVRDSIELAVHQPGSLSLGADTSYLCAGDSIVYQLSLDQGSFLWEDGSTSPNRSILSPGLYWVEAANACDTLRDTIEVLPLMLPTADLGPDTALCQGDVLSLSATAPQGSISWNTGSVLPQLMAGSTGTYIVEAQNACGIVRDTLSLEVHDPPVADLGNDVLLCEGETLELDLSQPFASYLWEDGSLLPTRTLSQAGLVHVAVTTACGTARDSMIFSLETPPLADLGPDRDICPGEVLSLDGSSQGVVSYQWSTGEQTSLIQVSTPGTYALTVNSQVCERRDTLVIVGLELPQLDLGADTLLCDGSSLLLDGNFPGVSYSWSTGDTSPQISVTQAGFYQLTLTNRCGEASDEIFIESGTTPTPDLGPDQSVCPGDTIWLDATTPFASYDWQDGATDPRYPATESGRYEVTVSTLCGEARAAMNLDLLPLPALSLGPDTLLCEGEFYLLEAQDILPPFTSNISLLWPDGSSGAEYVFSDPGAYLVTALNDCGAVTDTLLLDFRDCDCRVFVANAFSPNGDGTNDSFLPGLSCEFTSYQLSIYHRWGKQLFTTTDPSQGWDGLNAPEGVYTWTISYRWIGRAGVEVGEVKSGTVTLGR